MIEHDHIVPQRWEKSDSLYMKYLQCYKNDCLKELKERLRSASENRYFLLQQKAKYAGQLLIYYSVEYKAKVLLFFL